MKGFSILFFLLLLSNINVLIAQDKNEIFEKKTKITWLGLDFTAAMFIGDSDKFSSEEEVHNFMIAWNDLMLAEPLKFDIGMTFDKIKVENALDVTKDQNKKIRASEMVSTAAKDFFHLTPPMISEVILTYDFKGKEGIGLMFNIESFSKLNESGALWITFVNMKTKEVILTERMTGEPGGFGIRNYWAGCIYDILKQIRKKEYAVWRKKYYHS